MDKKEMLEILETIKFCDVDEVKKIKALDMAISLLKDEEEKKKKSEKNKIFEIGDIVYILGKYLPNRFAETYIIEAKISHIEHRQFVAYDTNGCTTWRFSNKHYNKSVFKTKKEAVKALEKYNIEEEKKI